MNGEFPPQTEEKTGSRAKALFEALKDPNVKDQAVETFINIGFPAVDAALSGAGRELGLTKEVKGRSRFDANPFIERVSKIADKPLPVIATRLAVDAARGARSGLKEHAQTVMADQGERVRFVDSARSLGGAVSDAYSQARQMQAAEGAETASRFQQAAQRMAHPFQRAA